MKKFNNIMVDIETLGTVPGSAIVSIGAVAFSIEDNLVAPVEFYQIVYQPSNFEFMHTVNPATLDWWDNQELGARLALAKSECREDSVHLKQALQNLNEFIEKISEPDKVCVWGNGSDFDNALLQYSFDQVGISPAWKFYNNRCYRTIKSLHKDIKINFEGRTHHNALEDAKAQTEHLLRILNGHTKTLLEMLYFSTDDKVTSLKNPARVIFTSTMYHNINNKYLFFRNSGIEIESILNILKIPTNEKCAQWLLSIQLKNEKHRITLVDSESEIDKILEQFWYKAGKLQLSKGQISRKTKDLSPSLPINAELKIKYSNGEVQKLSLEYFNLSPSKDLESVYIENKAGGRKWLMKQI